MTRLFFFLQLLSTPLPSLLRVRIYRAMGFEVDRTAKIMPFSLVISSNLTMEPMTRIRPFSFIYAPSNLVLRAYSGISFFTLIHGNSELEIGCHSQISIFVFIDLSANVQIGEWSGPAPFCSFMTHGVYWPTTWGFKSKIAPIKIGDFVWIHFGCRIGPGVTIADRNVILSGSTLSTNATNSNQILYDNGVKRTKIPFDFIQSQVSRAELTQMIESYLWISLSQLSKRWNASLSKEENFILISKNNQTLIAISSKTSASLRDFPKSKHKWICTFNIPENYFGEKQFEVLDFYRLSHSDYPSKKMRELHNVLRKNWGLRFVEKRFAPYIRSSPPPLIDEKSTPNPP